MIILLLLPFCGVLLLQLLPSLSLLVWFSLILLTKFTKLSKARLDVLLFIEISLLLPFSILTLFAFCWVWILFHDLAFYKSSAWYQVNYLQGYDSVSYYYYNLYQGCLSIVYPFSTWTPQKNMTTSSISTSSPFKFICNNSWESPFLTSFKCPCSSEKFNI